MASLFEGTHFWVGETNKISSGDIPNSMRSLVKPSWNPGETLVEPYPRAAPDPGAYLKKKKNAGSPSLKTHSHVPSKNLHISLVDNATINLLLGELQGPHLGISAFLRHDLHGCRPMPRAKATHDAVCFSVRRKLGSRGRQSLKSLRL